MRLLQSNEIQTVQNTRNSHLTRKLGLPLEGKPVCLSSEVFSPFSTRYMKSGSRERVEGPCRGLLASGSPTSAVTAVSALATPDAVPALAPAFQCPLQA